jgi:hypothetical protein
MVYPSPMEMSVTITLACVYVHILSEKHRVRVESILSITIDVLVAAYPTSE